ncbi:hypothetical protein SCWH03_33640 [Streptomyces pacificus]|uniref:Uncharacterized protein n=1 Tax=Streptomyces pacificus TaxID=2705029 RepID=A0A6A0AW09_9ACTN|nr:hypothetical protein SCWH03_33640 [Streptomyces pacificus]
MECVPSVPGKGSRTKSGGRRAYCRHRISASLIAAGWDFSVLARRIPQWSAPVGSGGQQSAAVRRGSQRTGGPPPRAAGVAYATPVRPPR